MFTTKCILGYKALMLCWSDGRTQLMLDFSLHGEKGKIEGKGQGLTSAQRKQRYERERDGIPISPSARTSISWAREPNCWKW